MNNHTILLKGLRFGLALQLAIGPICLFILYTAISHGLPKALTAVLGVLLADSLMILLALLGVGTIIEKSPRAKTLLKNFGALILLLFGLNMLAGSIGVQLFAQAKISTPDLSNHIFLTALLLTLANPLTIIFWSGIFSAKIVQENMAGKDLKLFALGCIISTLLFLTAISLLGTFYQQTIPSALINNLNTAVGLFMLYFALKTIRSK